MIHIEPERRRRYLASCRILALLSASAAAYYIGWLLLSARPSNLFLFYLLVGAELFNVTQSAGFWYTISMQSWTEPPTPDFKRTGETVDVYVTVCGEPPEIVAKTVAGACRIRHPRLNVWILDDKPSAEIEAIAEEEYAGYLPRDERRGAKAGNINDALAFTDGDLIAIFDADQVPEPDFLEHTLGAFEDPGVAFVQTPQFYDNKDSNRVAAGAHDQQALFYGPILRGKNGCRAVFSCGTNVVFKRSSIEAIGGMPEDSITEDLKMSLLLMKAGYKSLYVPRVLARGLGPVDLGGFFGQQRRWARGGLELFLKTPTSPAGLSVKQVIQYFLSFIFWFTGWSYASYLLLPVLFLLMGLRPVQVPNEYPTHFIPYVLVTLFTVAYASDFKLKFRGLMFTLGSFPVHISALVSTILARASHFVITPKKIESRSLRPATAHILASLTLIGASLFGLSRAGTDPSVLNNVAWALGHLLVLGGFIRLAVAPVVEPAGEVERKPLRIAERLFLGAPGNDGEDPDESGSVPKRVRESVVED